MLSYDNDLLDVASYLLHRHESDLDPLSKVNKLYQYITIPASQVISKFGVWCRAPPMCYLKALADVLHKQGKWKEFVQ